MSNQIEDNATYVLFGDEAVPIYKISIKHLLKTEGIDYTVGMYTSVKEFFKEKDKWRNYIEIDFSDYKTIKAHVDAKFKMDKKRKSFFSFFKLFN